MSDYWVGYQSGQANSRNDIGSGIVGAAILALLVVAAGIIGIAAFAYVALFPLATLLVAAAVAALTMLFSAGIEAVWNDPSPIYLLGSHWLYFNWVGFGLAVATGLALAWYALKCVEFRLHEERAYYLVRHVWRLMFPAATMCVVLAATRSESGINAFGLWAIPIAVAIALHFVLWNELFSLRERWMEAQHARDMS